MSLAPKTKILIADIADNEDRLRRLLGNARIRRIVDHMILIDGDLQYIARATGEPVALHKERRRP
jgi:hypothetical protein